MPKGIPFSGERKGCTLRRDGNGKLLRTNPASARNARPHKVHVKHGSTSALLHAQLDARTTLGRRYKADLLELSAHVGTPSVVQSKLIDTAVRLGLIADISWDELMQNGVVTNGTPSPALDAFLKICKGSVALAQGVPVRICYTHRTFPRKATMIDFKGHRVEKDIILTCARWYLAYPLSYQNLEEMMVEGSVALISAAHNSAIGRHN